MIINFTRPAIIAKQLNSKNELLRKEKLDYLTANQSTNVYNPTFLKKKRRKEQLIIWSIIGVMVGSLMIASSYWS